MEALGPEMGPKGGKEKRKRKKENVLLIVQDSVCAQLFQQLSDHRTNLKGVRGRLVVEQ